jgi:hypothetical protein
MRMTTTEIKCRKCKWKSRPEMKRAQAKLDAWTKRLSAMILGPVIARAR